MSSSKDFTIVMMNRRYSSWSMRGWLGLCQCIDKSDFDTVMINLAGATTSTPGFLPRSDILKYSPSGKAPALIDHKLGVTVYESFAIVLHLADRFPQANLLPTDPSARAMCLSACAEMHAGFNGLRNNLPHHCLTTGYKHGAIAFTKKEVQDDINRLGILWTELRTKYGSDGDFLFGSFGAADCMYAPVSVRFMTYDPELKTLANYPIAQQYIHTLYNMNNLQEWIEEAKKEGPDTYLDYYELVSDTYPTST